MAGSSEQTSINGSSPHIEERGSLRTLANNQSQFIGSSTGIYFVNMVRRAFADADVHLSPAADDEVHPSPEDCIVADEDDGRLGRQRSGQESSASPRAASLRPGTFSYGPGIPTALGQPPPQEVARKLFMTYFQTWHRFFPFLHGPTVGKDLESLYSVVEDGPPAGTSLPLPRAIILQCLFNLASLHSGAELPVASRIDRPARIVSCLLSFAAKGDIISIQALFASQLLLVARMSLRTAVVVAGLISRAIFLAGLHRCPVRYRDLSAEDCDIRKRLFWCIYILDRFLSQALGHPLGIQDSDIDVCSLSGPELHPPHNPPNNISTSAATHSLPNGNVGGLTVEGVVQKTNRNQALASQVEFSRLSGRALEIFHKSIHIRSIDPSTVLSLRTDLDAWWNSLPSELQDFGVADKKGPDPDFSAPAHFILLHRQLRLLINRPWLSLEPSTAEFQSALQVCISASRDIILTLRRQHDMGYGLFWPGYLSIAWMSGIILAFASHLHLYPVEKGQREITLCLDVLSGMRNCWPLARNCHIVLSDLQQIVRQRHTSLGQNSSSEPYNNLHTFTQRFPDGSQETDSDRMRAHKRMRLDPDEQTRHQPLGHYSGNAPSQHIDQQAEQANSIESTHTVSRGSASISAASRQFGHLQGMQPSNSPPFDQIGLQQQPMFSKPPNGPLHVTEDALNADEVRIPHLVSGGDNCQWSDLSEMSYWNGGMPDLLYNAAWESLFQGANQTDSWGG